MSDFHRSMRRKAEERAEMLEKKLKALQEKIAEAPGYKLCMDLNLTPLSKTMKIYDAITSQGIGTASYYRWLNRKLGR